MNLVTSNATDRFLGRLEGVSDPEEKRKIIGDEFIRVFRACRRRAVKPASRLPSLARGTLYPDVIQSSQRRDEGCP
ncbi:MAG: hypothetical protein R3A46_06500 [Thermomicrobiales bacterium]